MILLFRGRMLIVLLSRVLGWCRSVLGLVLLVKVCCRWLRRCLISSRLRCRRMGWVRWRCRVWLLVLLWMCRWWLRVRVGWRRLSCRMVTMGVVLCRILIVWKSRMRFLRKFVVMVVVLLRNSSLGVRIIVRRLLVERLVLRLSVRLFTRLVMVVVVLLTRLRLRIVTFVGVRGMRRLRFGLLLMITRVCGRNRLGRFLIVRCL